MYIYIYIKYYYVVLLFSVHLTELLCSTIYVGSVICKTVCSYTRWGYMPHFYFLVAPYTSNFFHVRALFTLFSQQE